jgi:hypothetical protein
MTDFTSDDILNFSVNQQPLKVGDAFDALMRDRVAAIVDNHRETFSQDAFNEPEEDDFDLEDDEDFAEDDVEDLDIDLEDEDFEDLEDLEDLDLDSDEDDTDEDA